MGIISGPQHGEYKVYGDTIVVYEPQKDFRGNDSIRYYIYDTYGKRYNDTATIFISVGPEVNITIHNAITPNGDGINDTWIIGGIENYPDNDVLIFNRWGDKVRSYKGYDNSSNVWDGTNRNGDPVPDGTYFYIIHISHVGKYSGWIFVRANSH
ncbi:MAG: gliding motility-associated C-terminal domain-containing protein, partial [Bacteroidota bacterium]|nr:gliding motility-associated C-terminal domain-containing protein [Bacteroidota bacterium]